jgi:hypothetical protein
VLLCWTFIRTDVSEERIASIIRMIKISKLRNLTLTSNQNMERTTLRNMPEDGIFHSHRRENLKSYIALTG